MAEGTQNNIRIKASPSGPVAYTVRTTRETGTNGFPLTTQGNAAMAAAIKAGTYPFPLVVEDNGAVIPANTVPPTTKPAAPALSAPTNVSAATASGTSINITWNAVSGASGYQIERSSNGSSGWTQIGTPTTALYSDTGLTTGSTYFYRVRATSGSATSGYSSVVNAATSYPAYSQTKQGIANFYVHSYESPTNPATTEDMPFTNAPKTASDYNFSFTYQSNQGSPGQGGIKVNGVRQITFNTEVADGGTRTITGTISLQQGDNLITFEYVSGVWYNPRSMTISRAAGA
ncbi:MULTISPECIES: fibronectin type III domain-containing protein [unclassified Spirosoma]|uniref:fibronectin type III domain-containing protein n=1 Tax=unclassified Spirosoma TaxID=2621999 RepID=UPI0009652C3E|nr:MULTISPECIES: fibronectin type III domain-containing protein [unclassified Spirosoma]MBN8820854.1 fibronectin type III domain-containing protein [Spirosoma sp.]OJW78050.1 MAG: hypothetical protein BGO59_28960 [Spirosoma sp. 48-14]